MRSVRGLSVIALVSIACATPPRGQTANHDPRCTLGPEDIDGFEDDDSCLDPDDDGDGVADVTDGCPCVPEDLDGFEDDDGCPEPDNDEDGIADGSDRCRMEPEDIDGYQDEHGKWQKPKDWTGPDHERVFQAQVRIAKDMEKEG